MSSQVAEKSFITTFVTLISALALLAAALFMVGALVGVVGNVAPDDGSRKQVAVVERIQPVARVALAVPGAASAELKLSAQEVYNKVCMACHATGAAGAPKVGAKDQWEPRFAQGLDTLVKNAVNGIRGMPAKGGNPALTETNLKEAIVYMLGETGIKTDSAPAPVADAPAAAPADAPAAAPADAPAAAPADAPAAAPADAPAAPVESK